MRLALVALAFAACGSDGRRGVPGAFTDPEVLAVLEAMCRAEIMRAWPSQEGGASRDVRAFADRIVFDETAALKRLGELPIEPFSTPLSDLIEIQGKQTVDRLRTLAGFELDREFLDFEIASTFSSAGIMRISLFKYITSQFLTAETTLQLDRAQDHLRTASSLRANIH